MNDLFNNLLQRTMSIRFHDGPVWALLCGSLVSFVVRSEFPNVHVAHDSLNRITTVSESSLAQRNLSYDSAGNRTNYSVTLDFAVATMTNQQMAANTALSLPLATTGLLPATQARWIVRSSNLELVPKSGIQVVGAGSDSPIVEITPALGKVGTARITVIASGVSAAAATSFLLTVGSNHAPVANDDSGNRPPGDGKEVLKSFLTRNDSDPDHDPFTVTAVAATSAHGGEVRFHGPFVFYTPPAGYDGPDFYNYTITDSHGVTALAAMRLSVVSPVQAVQLNSAPRISLPNGNILLTFAGRPGVMYDIQATTDLTNWVIVGTTNADSSGRYFFEESEMDLYPNRSYRAVFH